MSAHTTNLQRLPHVASALQQVSRSVVGELPNEGERSPRARLQRLHDRTAAAVKLAEALKPTPELAARLRAAVALARVALGCVTALEASEVVVVPVHQEGAPQT
jgi:hypothetical protein